jgi:hypothetical protein
MEKLAMHNVFQSLKKAPVGQAHRTPVGQAHRTPVGQAHRTPVGQATRNTIRNTERNTLSNTGESEKKIEGLTEKQKRYVMERMKVNEEELEKALTIIARTKHRNIMGLLMSSAFFEGECILTQDMIDVSKEDRLFTARNDFLRREGQRICDERRAALVSREHHMNQSLQALQWYQEELTDAQRAKVRDHILAKHPSTRPRFDSGDFGPAILAFLSVARLEMEDFTSKQA